MSATLRAEARRPELPPRRFLVRPALLAALLLWAYLALAASWSARAEVSVAWALLGAYLVPAAIVLESGRRLWHRDGISTVTLLRSMLLGSLLAAAGSATPDPVSALASGPPILRALVACLPAFAETAVIAGIVLVVGRRTAQTPRTGLFLGGALGAGFAAFAALSAVLTAIGALSGVPLPDSMPPAVVLEGAVALQQALVAALTSPVWGALIGAAVFASRRVLTATLAGVIVTHVLVDASTLAAAGLLGTSPTALAVQLLLTGAIAAPALVAWSRRARALRHTPVDQGRGGA